jgi:teichuronic acid biosynthesis glycosyltransferase TuaH
MMPKHSFLFASANTPWVYALAESLAERDHAVAAITLYDWNNFRSAPPQWPASSCPPNLERSHWTYPPGYMGRLETIFRPLLRRRWSSVLQRLQNESQSEPWIVCPYPWLVNSLREVNKDRLIYFNLDPYDLYRPERAEQILRQEAELINRAKHVICLAQTQVQAFQSRFPTSRCAFHHFPLAAPDTFLARAAGAGHAMRTVGYVGNLIDRVDWVFVREVAERLSDVEFVFVGYANVSGGGGQRPGWVEDRRRALALPNVRQVATVPQSEVSKHYQSFSLSWIPYATDHLFNYGSCPTKIMDGLASGRPIISTDIPECTLYPEWIKIARSADQAVQQIDRILAEISHPVNVERSVQQVAYVAANHTWRNRAVQLEALL